MALGSFFFGFSLCQILFVLLAMFLISLPVFYIRSNAVKYYTKLTVFYSFAILSAVFVIFDSIPSPRHWKNHRIVTWTCRHILEPLFGMDLDTRGMENVHNSTAAIVVVNHQSSLDIIPLFSAWPDHTVCLSKKEILYYTGSFGFAAWLCGTIYIDRSNSAHARKTMDETMQNIRRKKLKVLVFPEGTRNHKGSLLPFKKGAFHLAVQAQVPVIPIVLSSFEEFYSKPEKRCDYAGKIIMEALPPISTEGLTADDVTDLTEKTRNTMLECFERISQEVKGQTRPKNL